MSLEKPTIVEENLFNEKALIGLVGNYFDTPMLKEKILPSVILKIKSGEKDAAYGILRSKGKIVVGDSKFDSQKAEEVISFIEEFLKENPFTIPTTQKPPIENKQNLTEKEKKQAKITQRKEKEVVNKILEEKTEQKIEKPIVNEIVENTEIEAPIKNNMKEDRVKIDYRITKSNKIELEQPVTGVYHTNYEQDLLAENKKHIDVPNNIYKTQRNQVKEIKEMFNSNYEKNGFDVDEEPLYKNRNRKSDHIDVEDPWTDIENNSSLKINSKNNMAKEKPKVVAKSLQDLAKLKNNPEEDKVVPEKIEKKVDLKISPTRNKTDEIKKSLDKNKSKRTEKTISTIKEEKAYEELSIIDKLVADYTPKAKAGTKEANKQLEDYRKELQSKTNTERISLLNAQNKKISDAFKSIINTLKNKFDFKDKELEKMSLEEKIKKYGDLMPEASSSEVKKWINVENKKVTDRIGKITIIEELKEMTKTHAFNSKTDKELESFMNMSLEELIEKRDRARKNMEARVIELQSGPQNEETRKQLLELDTFIARFWKNNSSVQKINYFRGLSSEIERNPKLVEEIRKILMKNNLELVAHSDKKNKDLPDIDGFICETLLKNFTNADVAKLTLVDHGQDIAIGDVVFDISPDTYDKEGKLLNKPIVRIENGRLFVDNHTEGNLSVSSAEIMHYLLNSVGLYKDFDVDKAETIANLIESANDFDNMNVQYPQGINKVEYIKNSWPKTMNALGQELLRRGDSEVYLAYFNEGGTNNAELSVEWLNRKLHDGQTIGDLVSALTKQVENTEHRTRRAHAMMGQDGFKTKSSLLGKFIVDYKGEAAGYKDRYIQKKEVVFAMGNNSAVTFFEPNNSNNNLGGVFISARDSDLFENFDKIKEVFPDARMIRGKMIMIFPKDKIDKEGNIIKKAEPLDIEKVKQVFDLGIENAELTPVIDPLDLESLSLEELQDIYTKNIEIINQHDIKIAGLEKELTDLENNLKLEEQKKLHLENGVAYIKMLQAEISKMENLGVLDEKTTEQLSFYKEKLQAYENASFEEAETMYMSKEDLDKLFVSKDIPEIKVDEVVDGRTINRDNIEEAEVVGDEEEKISDIEVKKAEIERRRQEELDEAIIDNAEKVGGTSFPTKRVDEINAKYDAELAALEKENISTLEDTPTIKSIAEKIIKKEKLNEEEIDIQNENYEEIDAIVVAHLKKLLDKAKKDNENLINETQEEKELIIKLKNKFEDLKKKLPTYQENTRTQATQDLLDFAAELYNVPKYTEGLESGKYVSWLQSFKPEGYNASLYLNSPQKALEELSRYLTLLEKTL